MLRARHEMANTLVRYLSAVDDHDLDAVISELAEARVSFGGPALSGVDELTPGYRDAFANGGRTRHLLHEIEVEGGGEDPNGADVVSGRAGYQRWSLDTEPPTITALGRYEVLLANSGDGWHMTALTVHRDWQRSGTLLAPTRGRESR
ncbi:MAG TPA: nuclear transport factor 2 family protein [Nocardioidaceae bacterium]|nr:nuclear transport factor 2 family protein [Nocardioidaceae bacterium]